MVDGVRFAEHTLRRRPRHRRRRHQGAPRRGRGLHGEHHHRHRPARRAAGPGPGRHPPGPGRDRRRQGPRRGGAGGVRPPRGPTLPAPQGPQRRATVSPTGSASTVAKRMRAAYRDRRAPCSAEAAARGPRRELAKTHPGAAGSLREGLAETLTDPAARRAAHPRPHAALDQRHRVDDRDLPGPRQPT